ncbi:MAG: protein-disulfide isomerase, partial [Sphingomonas sp.]
MTNRILALALPALLIAGCGDNSKGTGTTTAASAPVAGKAAPAGQSWTDTVVKTADYGYRMGNPDAPIKLVEYGSRACPFCAQFEAEGFPLLEAMMANQQTLLAKEQEVAQKVQGMQGASPQTIAATFAQDLGYLDFVKQRGVPDAKARACLADST